MSDKYSVNSLRKLLEGNPGTSEMARTNAGIELNSTPADRRQQKFIEIIKRFGMADKSAKGGGAKTGVGTAPSPSPPPSSEVPQFKSFRPPVAEEAPEPVEKKSPSPARRKKGFKR